MPSQIIIMAARRHLMIFFLWIFRRPRYDALRQCQEKGADIFDGLSIVITCRHISAHGNTTPCLAIKAAGDYCCSSFAVLRNNESGEAGRIPARTDTHPDTYESSSVGAGAGYPGAVGTSAYHQVSDPRALPETPPHPPVRKDGEFASIETGMSVLPCAVRAPSRLAIALALDNGEQVGSGTGRQGTEVETICTPTAGCR